MKDKIKFKGKERNIQYIFEPKKGNRGERTIAYIELDDGHVIVGIAERYPDDEYDIVQARTVATGRLIKRIKKYEERN